MSESKKTGLELLRDPFPANQIGKLAKGSKAQTQCDAKEKQNCNICGGWHHPKMIHLDYVGHAALTDRLLDADPKWYWEPLAFDDRGLPAFDQSGGLWIKLTVCGVTRLGYGNAESSQFKEVGARDKEVIGDALRNAAMRFGAALELWHKGDLHAHLEDEPEEPKKFGGMSPSELNKQPAPDESEVRKEYLGVVDNIKLGLTNGDDVLVYENAIWLNNAEKLAIKANGFLSKKDTDAVKAIVERINAEDKK